ncbi:jg10073 [Pararge aegeria aegeria]|uniref:Jg10073 protein n=1 Tax=Pararge aegeria aegeria TaxID=348720 RepID=A0A8S4SB66_9NEOP|nr:jg10073 [Pararge aegeria aegeria]
MLTPPSSPKLTHRSFINDSVKLKKNLKHENENSNESKPKSEKNVPDYNSKPVLVKAEEIMDAEKNSETKSDGFNYELKNKSHPKDYNNEKTTDQDTTDSICSGLDSPENPPVL